MADLSFHIKTFCPDADVAETDLRLKLLKARDWAAVLRGQTDPGLANDLACLAHETAGAFVFREGETAERLDAAVRLCRHMVGAAMNARLLEDRLGWT